MTIWVRTIDRAHDLEQRAALGGHSALVGPTNVVAERRVPSARPPRDATANYLRLLTAMVTIVAGAVVGAAPAYPASRKYLETNCVIKAPWGHGLKGHGCDEWGMPHWVEVGQRGHPLPAVVERSVVDCLVHGTYGLVEYITEGGLEEMPPPYDVIGGLAYIADGCVKGVTEANVRLGRH